MNELMIGVEGTSQNTRTPEHQKYNIRSFKFDEYIFDTTQDVLHKNFGFYLRLFMTKVKTQLNSKFETRKALTTFFSENSVKAAVYIVIGIVSVF